jgi:hypothetical protein
MRSGDAAGLGEHIRRIRPKTTSLCLHLSLLYRIHHFCRRSKHEDHYRRSCTPRFWRRRHRCSYSGHSRGHDNTRRTIEIFGLDGYSQCSGQYSRAICRSFVFYVRHLAMDRMDQSPHSWNWNAVGILLSQVTACHDGPFTC